MSTPAVTRAWADQCSDLYRRICTVLNRYTFTTPVEPDDVATVRAELAAAVPECTVSATVDDRYVWFSVYLAERRVYHSPKIIEVMP